MCLFKKKVDLSLAIEDKAKKKFYVCFVALEKPYL
jgi:hypothetical protein